MKNLGIVRNIDKVNRMVIPKEFCRSLRIDEGVPIEIFLDGDTICMRKYSPLGMLSDSANDLLESFGHRENIELAVTDADKVIASQNHEYLNKPLSYSYVNMATTGSQGSSKVFLTENGNERIITILPIIIEDNFVGSLAVVATGANAVVSEKDSIIIEYIARTLKKKGE